MLSPHLWVACTSQHRCLIDGSCQKSMAAIAQPQSWIFCLYLRLVQILSPTPVPKPQPPFEPEPRSFIWILNNSFYSWHLQNAHAGQPLSSSNCVLSIKSSLRRRSPCYQLPVQNILLQCLPQLFISIHSIAVAEYARLQNLPSFLILSSITTTFAPRSNRLKKLISVSLQL